MTQASSNSTPAGKGKAFFDRADQVADTGSWDFAIDLYLEGIQREPDSIQRGHQKLRDVSLKRTATGGKPAGFMEKRKRPQPGKDPLSNLLYAEFLLAKEPGSEVNMEAVLKAAVSLEQPELVKWICGIILESQKLATKRSKRLLLSITQAYHNIQEYAQAAKACDLAFQLDPNDARVGDQLADLMAKETIKKGGYASDGGFEKSVRDIGAQRNLMEQDSLQQSVAFRQEQVERARQEYLQAPTVPGKVYAYIDALLKMQDEGSENEAADVLLKAYNDTNAYQFKLRVGDIRMKQMTRRYRKFLTEGDKAAAAQAARDQLEFELKEYTERATNIPTDMAIKYELGRRQLVAGKTDDAIASLQQARRDSRNSIQANSLLGQAFWKKGWLKEAADTFESILAGELNEDREKEIRYLLGRVYEDMKEFAKALNEYSRVAQIDFTYKDVRDRIERLRKEIM